MNAKALLPGLSSFALALLTGVAAQAADCPALLDHRLPALQTGKPVDLCQYRDKVVLVVNTASKCGHTDQYGGLEDLYRRYKDRGLVVLGFPSNNFGGQEPGSNAQIAAFCRSTYGVEFPLFGKSDVVGAARSRLYQQLHERTGEAPKWNFHKYLLAPNGAEVHSFDSAVAPEDDRLLKTLHRLLEQRNAPKRKT